MTVTEKLGAYGRSAGATTLKSGNALVDAVGRLVDAAVDRVLLSDDRVTSAADGKQRLSGQAGTEDLADKVQWLVVLATPVVPTRIVGRIPATTAARTRIVARLPASTSQRLKSMAAK